MASKIKYVGIFLLCFGFGIKAFLSIADKNSIQRDPAALNGKIYQITTLTSEQIRDQLQKKIRVSPTIDGKKAILFPGFSSALCKTYTSISIEFVAEGIAVAGEAPVMKVTAPCAEGQDPAEIAAINLAISKILNQKPRDAEYNFDGFNGVVSFKNSSDEWPRQWILKRVEFLNAAGENKSAEFKRGPASTGESATRPIVLEF